MRKFTKIKTFLLILGIIIAFTFLSNTYFSDYYGDNDESFGNDTEPKLKRAGYWEIGPINIDDTNPSQNWVITAATYDWCRGSGSWSDPYIIENVTIDGQNSDSCITIKNSDVYFIIRNCTLFNANDYMHDAGIDLYNVDNGIITNNTVSNNNNHGILLQEGSNNTFTKNRIQNNGVHGILFERLSNIFNNTISENIISNNNDYGICLDGYNGLDIRGNHNISGNIIKFNGIHGIYSFYSPYNFFSNNTIFSNNNDGIHIQYGDNSIISGNNITDNINGIYYDRCDYNTITKNIFNNNEYGIKIYCGSTQDSSKNNIITENNFIGNTLYGLLIDTRCNYNSIYINNFIGNTINAYDYGNNNDWDNGSLGNYWDDYGGVDANDDGIGDTPYDVPPVGESVDNYPIWRDGDDVGPDITIDLPIEDEIFGIDAPNFTITITDQTLNTTWYTIDGGLTNFTFSGFEGTVNQPAWDDKESGPILLRFYANDSVGNIGFEDVNIEKDAEFPTITINSPTPNQMCGVQAPIFDVNINDPHFHKKWYSLNGGENITFTTETQIDQILWDKFGNGTVLITFYANDTLSNENSTQVMVRKDVYLPKIVINSPTPDELFEETPPSFNVEIRDPNRHKMWYTIDGGLPKIFTENESITQELWDAASDGIVILTFYANDTAGNINSTSVNIIKDTAMPSIEILSPVPNKIFREIAPAFELSITEANLVSTWYSIDGGLTNTSFTGLQGVIDEILWWEAPLGPVTIRFYAEDIAGNIGYKDVVVIKDIVKLINVEIVDQSFSNVEFNITFFILNETGHGISNAAIEIWWDGKDVSANIQNLGEGFYFISLEPITVAPGEDPILLSMTISTSGYEDKNFEMYLAVDPDTLEKEVGKRAEGDLLAIIIIAIASTAGGVGVATVTIVLLRKRKRTSEKS